MHVLMILNDPPYGSERVYNGLRLAKSLLATQAGVGDVRLDVFLLGDSASAGKSGQRTPDGYYNVEKMMLGILRRGASVRVCGTCMDARGLTDAELISGAQRSTLDELTALTLDSDKVLVF